jgi:hypothetical protein
MKQILPDEKLTPHVVFASLEALMDAVESEADDPCEARVEAFLFAYTTLEHYAYREWKMFDNYCKAMNELANEFGYTIPNPTDANDSTPERPE